MQAPSEFFTALGLWHNSSREATPTLPDTSTLFWLLTGTTPLDYALSYLPDQVERLLEQGEDATVGVPIERAASYGHIHLIHPLLVAEADINAADFNGKTALHHACYTGNFALFGELVRLAEQEIGWGIRTLEGKTALQLAQESFRQDGWSHLLPSDREVFFNTLRVHIPDEDNGEDEPLGMPGALV